MKKLIPFYSIIFFIGVFFFINQPRSIPPPEGLTIFREEIGIQLPEDTVILTEEETHGGINNDGHTLYIYQLKKESIDVISAQLNNSWSACPLPEILLEKIESDINIGRAEEDYISLDCKNGYYTFRNWVYNDFSHYKFALIDQKANCIYLYITDM